MRSSDSEPQQRSRMTIKMLLGGEAITAANFKPRGSSGTCLTSSPKLRNRGSHIPDGRCSSRWTRQDAHKKHWCCEFEARVRHERLYVSPTALTNLFVTLNSLPHTATKYSSCTNPQTSPNPEHKKPLKEINLQEADPGRCVLQGACGCDDWSRGFITDSDHTHRSNPPPQSRPI
jgi:hypothetical protein